MRDCPAFSHCNDFPGLLISYLAWIKHLSQIWKFVNITQKHGKKKSYRKQTMRHSASNFHWNSACNKYRNAESFGKSSNAFIFINVMDKQHRETYYYFHVHLFSLLHSPEELKVRYRIVKWTFNMQHVEGMLVKRRSIGLGNLMMHTAALENNSLAEPGSHLWMLNGYRIIE